MNSAQVKIKAIRSKGDKAGAQLGPKKAFSILRLCALILFQFFVCIEIGKPLAGALGGATKQPSNCAHCV